MQKRRGFLSALRICWEVLGTSLSASAAVSPQEQSRRPRQPVTPSTAHGAACGELEASGSQRLLGTQAVLRAMGPACCLLDTHRARGSPARPGQGLAPALVTPRKARAEPVLQGGTGSVSPRHRAGVLGLWCAALLPGSAPGGWIFSAVHAQPQPG